MAQEFIINSSAIEDKINQLLPSQGGFGAGIDFSASTMVIPVVNLTEAAEGSSLRQDLQSSLSHTSITPFTVINATTTLVATTGYYRVFGLMSGAISTSGATGNFSLSDGTTDKIIMDSRVVKFETTVGANSSFSYDFIVFLKAGDSLKGISASTAIALRGCTRQIADINGNLTNP